MNDLHILSSGEIQEELKKAPGWKLEKNKISKEFRFKSFPDVIKFINELADFSNTIDHHPDIHIYYKKVIFELTRFDVGFKLTNRDFIVAQKIDDMFKDYQQDAGKIS
jgi:4a-hydroxytetrahydrobiopterin dehydratase